MRAPRLFSRRLVWLPTLWGCALLTLLALAALLLLARALHPYLAPDEPAHARVLVVEGWMGPSALDQVAAAIRAGGYERVITTGGPTDAWPRTHPTFADRAADYLRHAGVPQHLVVAVPAPQSLEERTYQSAVAVREWAKRNGVALEAIDVYSVGTHARRSRLLYRLAFRGGVEVGVRAARPADYDPEAWWRTSVGARHVLDEAIGLLWVKLFFRAPD